VRMGRGRALHARIRLWQELVSRTKGMGMATKEEDADACCTERYSRRLPVKSVEFERRDYADNAREFGEAPPVPGGEYLPVLEMRDASLDSRS
jgi:hypothetical protein